MKKRLLLMALAVMSVAVSFAADYVYTTTGRMKLVGENIVTNGDFSDGLTGWTSPDGVVDQSTWLVLDGAGPDGEAVVQSQGATADASLCRVVTGLEGGAQYVVSFKIKPAEPITTTVGTTVGSNYANIFQSATGALTYTTEGDNPDKAVATATTVSNIDDWTTVAFSFMAEEGYMLVIRFEKMVTGTQIADISVNKANVVSDDRVLLREIEWIKAILNDPNFESADSDAKDLKEGMLEQIEEDIPALYDDGELEDPTEMEAVLENYKNDLADYMDYTSYNQKDQLANIDIVSIGNYGRGRFSSAGCIELLGGSWSHSTGADFLMNHIQKGYHLDGTFIVKHTDFPAGKYFFTAEVRNANTIKSYGEHTFTLQTTSKIFVGKDSAEIVVGPGEDYQRFYLIANVDEAGAFRAGVEWPGVEGNNGGAFFVKNVEVRAFEDIAAQITRKKLWDAFINQWNAAVNARNKVVAMQTDKAYPWAKDSLQRALDQWDPYYNAVINAGWLTADNADAGVASNEELEAWAKYNGVDIERTVENEDGTTTVTKLEYQLVRNYQWAAAYVTNKNQVFADLDAEIVNAKAIRDDDMNAQGDKATFNAAIDAAQNLYDTKTTTTTDATMQADSLEVAAGIEALKTAEEVFKNSVPELLPIVDIDFSNGFEEVTAVLAEGEEPTLQGYVIKGAAGQMEFLASGVNLETPDSHTYALGHDGENLEVLHVGSTEATVNLAEADIPTDNDILRVQFDLWLGNLGGGYMTVELRNAANERVAGFSIDRYNANVAYNDFNDVLTSGGEGMDIRAYASGLGSGSVGNNGICVDANKSSFDLIIDYKAQSIQGTLVNAKNGTTAGRPFAFGDVLNIQNLTDTKITKFVITSNYQKANATAQARRCWFDNLVMLKYPSTATEPIPTGIETVAAPVQKADNAIYTLSGVKMNGSLTNLKRGLYIINGKKYVVK